MTTTRSRVRSHARSVLGAMACSSVLAASAVLVPTAHAVPPEPATSSLPRPEVAGHRVVHHDARRDVLLFDEKSQTRRPAPRDRATDIITTVVDHRASSLVMHVRARQLVRSGYRLMIAEILTSEGQRFEFVVDYSTVPIDARISLMKFGSGATVSCAGASWSMSASVNQVAASIPDSCLGDPDEVRVGVALSAAPRDLKTSWADDSRARGRIGDEHLELGPRQPQAS